MTNNSEYSETILELIKTGKEKQALDFCKSIPILSDEVECQKFIAWILYENNEYKKACDWFTPEVIKNDNEALLGLGWSLYGAGAKFYEQKDYKNAHIEFQKSLDTGFNRAYYWLGKMYELGYGVNKDILRAKELYTKAENHGYLIAKRALIQINLDNSSGLSKIMISFKVILLMLEALNIARVDINDERLSGVPNYFQKKSSRGQPT